MNNSTVVLTNQHRMFRTVYNRNLDYFTNLLNEGKNKVIKAVSVDDLNGYDYSFLLHKEHPISTEVVSKFGRAGLITNQEQLTGKTHVIRLKY